MTQSRGPDMRPPAGLIRGAHRLAGGHSVPRNTKRRERPVSDKLIELPVVKRRRSDALLSR